MQRSLLAIAAIALLAGSTAPAIAASGAGPRRASPHAPPDFSSARKHRRTRVYVSPHTPAARPPYAWRPADPSFGPYRSLRNARRQEPNRCIEDLGYGRWRYCDWD